MENSDRKDTSAPPLPVRASRPPIHQQQQQQQSLAAVHHTPSPGRAVRQVQGIETLRPAARENDYVDTRSLPVRKTASSKPKSGKGKTVDLDLLRTPVESCDNLKKADINSTEPPLPPRKNPPGGASICRSNKETPPPLLPRQSRSRLQTDNSMVTVPVVRTKSTPVTSPHHQQHTLPMRSNSHHLQPSVLIITDKPSLASTLRRTNAATGTTNINAAITKQPSSTKPLTTIIDKTTGLPTNSIICNNCGECRCASCTGDRPLPERWLCDGNCRCSADSVVDIASCMCLVKGLYNIRSNSTEDNHINSKSNRQERIHPCDCTPSGGCCARWSGLALLTACFPCLLCYLPMKAGVKCAEACYNSSCCRERGCQCER